MTELLSSFLVSILCIQLLQVGHFAAADLDQESQKANELLFQLLRIKESKILEISLNELSLLQAFKKDLHLPINTIALHDDFNQRLMLT